MRPYDRPVPTGKTRQPDRVRGTGWCSICHARAEGFTTIEHRPWDDPPATAYHLCDACREAHRPRPLGEVLDSFLIEHRA